jgi:hypothetical protein
VEQKITTDELKTICARLIKYVEDFGVEDISFEDKGVYYFKVWHSDRRFDDEFLKCPNYSLGLLDDDIENLKKILSSEYEPCSLALEWRGAILMAFGATVSKQRNVSLEK